jgi:3-methyladenine DNA glycosylase AlkD
MKGLLSELYEHKNSEKARVLQSFFKTGDGEYGAGDIFLGIQVPILRKLVKKYGGEVSMDDVEKLLYSKIHEERMLAVLFLVQKYSSDKTGVYKFYLKNAKQINNWDLVDVSCHKVVGDYLLNRNRKILYELSKSKNIWEKRIAIISTFKFIRENDFSDTLKISSILLGDSHDLIHKAVGWMLREVGKRDRSILEEFLEKHLGKMPKVTLRYAVEKFSREDRLKWYGRNS